MPASPPVPTLFRDSLMEARCTKCGAKMTLARIEPAKPHYDLRTFECTKCNNVDQYIVEIETSSPWVLVVRGSWAASVGGSKRRIAHPAGIILGGIQWD
jgi:hypothetical protein